MLAGAVPSGGFFSPKKASENKIVVFITKFVNLYVFLTETLLFIKVMIMIKVMIKVMIIIKGGPDH